VESINDYLIEIISFHYDNIVRMMSFDFGKFFNPKEDQEMHYISIKSFMISITILDFISENISSINLSAFNYLVLEKDVLMLYV
jgi:hypothetical protein